MWERHLRSYSWLSLPLSIVAVIMSYASHAETIPGVIEAGAIYYELNNGFAPTQGAFARARVGPVAKNEWLAEFVHLDRFGDDGQFYSVGNLHHFNSDWYSQVNIGSSSGGFFWPALRIDASISHKWLAQRNLVTTVGVSYFDAKDEHTDTGVTASAAYYFQSPWVIQAGTTINSSNPGGVVSASGQVAGSYVVNHKRIVSLGISGGHQAYQALTVNRAQVDFPYYSVRMTWKEWLGSSWGVNVSADSYQSKVYDQRGVELGLFKEF